LPRDRLRQGREGQGDERHHRDDRSDGRGGPGAPEVPGDAVPLLNKGKDRGESLEDGGSDPQAEVQGPAAQPLPALRAAACLPPEVPDVPDLLPDAGAPRRDPWCDQVLLVREAYAARDRTTAWCGEAGRAPSRWENSDGQRNRSDRRRSEEHTSELQSRENLVCRLLLEKKK